MVLVFLFLLLTGCTTQSETRIDPLQGQLLIWHNWTPGSDATELQGLIDGFSLIHPNVTIVTEYVPDREFVARYLDQTRAGLGPDLLVGIEPAYVRDFVDAGVLVALDEYDVDVANLKPATVEALRLNNHLYAIPFSAYTNVLYYNRALGGTALSTVPDLVREAQAGRKVGIPTDFYNAAWGIGSFGGTIFDENGQLALEQNGGFSDWLTWLSTAQRNPNVILSNDVEQLRQLFEEGELAYFIGSSYEQPYFQATMGEEVVGVGLLPPFGQTPAVPFMRLEVIAVSKSSARRDLGVALAEFLINTTQQRKLALSNLGRIPMAATVGSVALRVDTLASQLVQQRDHALVVPLANTSLAAQLQTVGDAIYNQVLEGVLSPQEAAALLTNTLNTMTAEQTGTRKE